MPLDIITAALTDTRANPCIIRQYGCDTPRRGLFFGNSLVLYILSVGCIHLCLSGKDMMCRSISIEWKAKGILFHQHRRHRILGRLRVINFVQSDDGLHNDRLLPVAELLHRVSNEYTRVISLASVTAAKSSSQETKAALRDIITELHSTAEIHSVLRPPLGKGLAVLTEALTRLCCAMTASGEFRRRGINLALRVEHPILICAGRCWRASLVVAELISNSCRHAFASRSGCIFVTVCESGDRVFCNVSDDGSPAEIGAAGLGTRIVDALAGELDGLVERRFSESGATVMLSFAKRAPIAVFQPDEYPVGQMSLWQTRDSSPVVDANASGL